MNSFKVFKTYVAIKAHFNENKSYDLFEMKGAIKVSKSSFEKRKDRYYFEKLSRNYIDKEIVEFFVSNFIYNSDSWIGDILESEEVYFHWIQRIEAFHYNLNEDLNNIKNFMKSKDIPFKELFRARDNEHPIIFQFLLKDMIQLETFVLIDMCLKITDKFDERIKETYIWPSWSYKVKQYKPFLHRKAKIEQGKKILLDFLKENM